MIGLWLFQETFVEKKKKTQQNIFDAFKKGEGLSEEKPEYLDALYKTTLLALFAVMTFINDYNFLWHFMKQEQTGWFPRAF